MSATVQYFTNNLLNCCTTAGLLYVVCYLVAATECKVATII